VVDLNNDGISQLILRSNAASSGSYSLWIGQYDNPASSNAIVTLPSSAHAYTKAIIADLDADGTPDIVLCTAASGVITAQQIHYRFRTHSSGTGYTFMTETRQLSLGAELYGDFTGDGIAELVTTSGQMYKFATGNPGHLMASVTNGSNQKTLFVYAPLTKTGTNFYTKGAGAWPTPNLAGPMYVVEALKQDNGLVPQSTTNYTYAEGKIHALGKGFLGFSAMTAKNATFDAETKIENLFDLTRGTLSKSTFTAKRGYFGDAAPPFGDTDPPLVFMT
jgi:hypothetical protein